MRLGCHVAQNHARLAVLAEPRDVLWPHLVQAREVAVVAQVSHLDASRDGILAHSTHVIQVGHAVLVGEELHRGQCFWRDAQGEKVLRGSSTVLHNVVEKRDAGLVLGGHLLREVQRVVDVGQAGLVQLASVRVVAEPDRVFRDGRVQHSVPPHERVHAPWGKAQFRLAAVLVRILI